MANGSRRLILLAELLQRVGSVFHSHFETIFFRGRGHACAISKIVVPVAVIMIVTHLLVRHETRRQDLRVSNCPAVFAACI